MSKFDREITIIKISHSSDDAIEKRIKVFGNLVHIAQSRNFANYSLSSVLHN